MQWFFGRGRPDRIVDPLDLKILGAMFRGQALGWGSFDPRLSAQAVAQELDLPRSTVAARIQAWQECGLLDGFEVWPNPVLFGARSALASVRAQSVALKGPLLNTLEDVDGMIAAFDQVGSTIWIAFAAPSEAAVGRRLRTIERLPGVATVGNHRSFQTPVKGGDPTPLEWRILGALREGPRRTLNELARSVGVTAKTLRVRYERMLQNEMLWYVPIMDFTQWTGGALVRFGARLEAATRPGDVHQALAVLPEDVTWADSLDHSKPDLLPDRMDFIAHLPAVGLIDEVQQALSTVPGLVRMVVGFPRGVRSYPHWFDEQIKTALEAHIEA